MTFEQLHLFDIDIIPWGYCYDCYTKTEWKVEWSRPWCDVCKKHITPHNWSMQKKFKELAVKNRFLNKTVKIVEW